MSDSENTQKPSEGKAMSLSDVAALYAAAPQMAATLEAIKSLVCGDAEPRWPNELRVTARRNAIADLCDAALSLSRAHGGEK